MEWLKLRGRPISGWSQYFMLLVAGLLIGVFLGSWTQTTSVSAADAVWNGQEIVHDNNSHTEQTNAQELTRLNLNSGEKVYTYSYTVPSTTTPSQAISVIYFPAGSTPQTATNATHVIYDVAGTQYTPRAPTQIAVGENSGKPNVSCGIDGVGWWVCPPSMWIAGGMDWIFNQLTSFLQVRPLETTNTTSTFYQAWNIMRSFANAAFIIAFLIIIYSHVTSLGISNYGIKKLAPRLVIAAVLVNVSYHVCAIGVDLSNMAGYAVKDTFDQLLVNLMTNAESNNQGMGSFADVMQTFLSGGTLLLAGGAAVGASLLAATPFFVPLMAILFLSLLVALLVMAARQAIITIFIIISPLAFVCYLLPGTEKWFERWRDTFVTMLVFFPAFAALFGGAQLAGKLISTNAQSTVVYILGIAVQLAPLAITPLIMKISGGLLGKFAGMVNDPSKGLVDKSKQWARDQSKDIALRRQEAAANYSNRAKKFGAGGARRFARHMNHRSRALKDRLANAEKMAENGYLASRYNKANDTEKRELEIDSQIIQKELDTSWNTKLKIDPQLMEKDLKLRVVTDKEALTKADLDNRYLEFKDGHHPTGFTGPLGPNDPMFRLMQSAQETSQQIAAQGLRQANAQRSLNKHFAEEMMRNTNLQSIAGSVYGDAGVDAALASAIATMRSEYGKSVQDGAEIVKHFNLSSDQRQIHAKGGTVTATDSNGNTRTFSANNTYTREAAIEEQIAVGTVDQVREIVELSGSSMSEYKTTISAALAKSGVKGKAPYMGGKLIDDIAKGAITSKEDLIGYIQDWIADGKYRDEDIAITDPDGLKLLMEAVRAPTTHMTPRLRAQMSAGVAGLQAKAQKSLDTDDLNQHISQKAHPLMEKISRGDFTP